MCTLNHKNITFEKQLLSVFLRMFLKTQSVPFIDCISIYSMTTVCANPSTTSYVLVHLLYPVFNMWLFCVSPIFLNSVTLNYVFGHQ